MPTVEAELAHLAKKKDVISEMETILACPAKEILCILSALNRAELAEFSAALCVLKKYLATKKMILSPQEIEEILADLEQEMQAMQ